MTQLPLEQRAMGSLTTSMADILEGAHSHVQRYSNMMHAVTMAEGCTLMYSYLWQTPEDTAPCKQTTCTCTQSICSNKRMMLQQCLCAATTWVHGGGLTPTGLGYNAMGWLAGKHVANTDLSQTGRELLPASACIPLTTTRSAGGQRASYRACASPQRPCWHNPFLAPVHIPSNKPAASISSPAAAALDTGTALCAPSSVPTVQWQRHQHFSVCWARRHMPPQMAQLQLHIATHSGWTPYSLYGLCRHNCTQWCSAPHMRAAVPGITPQGSLAGNALLPTATAATEVHFYP